MSRKHITIIAEAGVNHGGKLKYALELAHLAKSAGADIVKYQTFDTNKLIRPTDTETTKILKGLELSDPEWINLSKYCETLGIEFLTTPGDVDNLKFAVEELGVKRIKIGSDDLTYKPLVEAAHKTGLPLILSTGMATTIDVEDAVCSIDNFSLLHCVSIYPARPDQVNLHSIPYLKNTYRCPVGYSDHTAKNAVCVAAVAAGADILETHIKLGTFDGIDDAVSFSPVAFHSLVYDIRELELWLGSYGKGPVPEEVQIAKLLRKSSDGLRP